MPSQPDTGSPAELPPAQERLATAALAMTAFALNLNTSVLGALQPFLPQSVLPESSSFGYLLSAAAWGSAIGALAIGPVADRIGRRRPLLAGLLVFVAASALHCLVEEFGLLLLLRLVSGIAVGVAYACASAIAAELAPYHRRGRTMGIFTAGLFLAVPVGLPVANLLGGLGCWQAIFGVQAAFGLLGLGFAARAVPRDAGAGRWVAPWNMLRRGPVLAALLAVLLHVGSFFTTVQMATRWLDETRMVPKADQGWLWVVLGLASAVGSFVLGRTSDRVGKRNFVLMTSIVLVACLVLLAGTTTFGRLLPLGLLLAVAAAARTGPLQALTSGLVPSYEMTSLMGLRAFAMQAGVGAFALMAAGLDELRGFAAVLVAAAVCQLLSYLAIRFGVPEARS